LPFGSFWAESNNDQAYRGASLLRYMAHTETAKSLKLCERTSSATVWVRQWFLMSLRARPRCRGVFRPAGFRPGHPSDRSSRQPARCAPGAASGPWSREMSSGLRFVANRSATGRPVRFEPMRSPHRKQHKPQHVRDSLDAPCRSPRMATT